MTKPELLKKLTGEEEPKFVTERENTLIEAFLLIYNNELSSQLDCRVIKKNADGVLPCPFCGSDGMIGEYQTKEDNDHKIYIAQCSSEDCNVLFGEPELTKEDAIETWNKRK